MTANISPVLPRLLRAAYWFDEALRASQALQGQTPVSRAQAMLLINIALGERRPVRLARTLGVSKQAVSLTLSDLIADGSLSVGPDPEDARASIVEFTPLGSEKLMKIFEILQRLEEYLSTIIGQDRMSVLRAALDIDWGPPPALVDDESGAGDVLHAST